MVVSWDNLNRGDGWGYYIYYQGRVKPYGFDGLDFEQWRGERSDSEVYDVLVDLFGKQGVFVDRYHASPAVMERLWAYNGMSIWSKVEDGDLFFETHYQGKKWESGFWSMGDWTRHRTDNSDQQIFEKQLKVEKDDRAVFIDIPTNQSETTAVAESEDDPDGMDDYTVIRRVGSYGYCSSGDGHFVVRTFEVDKMKWWFLSEENGYERVFMEVFEDLNGKEFMTSIDAIIDNQMKPGIETANTLKAKPFLFRKRGAKDYTSFCPTPGSV
jgi:hypothetical protein